MEKYILQILENNSRVIVPEFGAFIVKQKSPLTIVFNEFLQYNDGMLVDTIAKGESIGRDAAKEKVDAFVKNITTSLDKTGKFAVNELGLLVKNSAGKISLDSSEPEDEKEKPKTKAPTPAVEQEKKKPEKPSEVKIPKKIKTEEIPASKKAIPSVPKNKQIEKEEKKEVVKENASATPKATTKRAMVKPVAEESKIIEKKDEPARPLVSVKETIQTEPVKKGPEASSFEKRVDTAPRSEKKKSNKIILWVIVIVLINAGIFAFFYFNGYLSGLFGSNDDTEELLVPIMDTDMSSESDSTPSMDPMIEEELIENKPAPVAPPVPVQSNNITGRKYYIVAGVFSVENNANNLVEELRGKGYNSEKFGRIGNTYAVSYGVYSSKGEANKALNEIKASDNAQAWIKVIE